jgi:molecular chaperone DnaK
MYKATASQAQPGPQAAPTDGAGQTGGQKKDEGVIDAEYVDVDEKKG